MKNLAILFVLLFAVVSTYAQHNAPVSASATFDCKVIAPLLWTAPQVPAIPDVIAGQTRTFAGIPVVFSLSGENGYNITVTSYGPDAVDPSNTTVSLLGSWGTVPTALNGTGAATMTYTCTGVESDAGTDHGTYQFLLKVDAVYTDL